MKKKASSFTTALRDAERQLAEKIKAREIARALIARLDKEIPPLQGVVGALKAQREGKVAPGIIAGPAAPLTPATKLDITNDMGVILAGQTVPIEPALPTVEDALKQFPGAGEDFG